MNFFNYVVEMLPIDKRHAWFSFKLAAAVTAEAPEPEAPVAAPPVEPTATAMPPVSQGQTRPTVVPSSSSAWTASSDVSATAAGFGMLVAVGAALI